MNSTRFALTWNALETFGKQAVSIVTTIVLARLLDPKDFGLIGMIYIFIAIASTLVEGGFTSALIYKKKPTQNDYSSVFYISIIISLFFYILLFISSKFIAAFYDQPSLVQILRWLSLSLIFGSLSVVHYAIFSSNMNFKSIAEVGLIAQVIASVAAIVTAIGGFGVWALVVQYLVLNSFTPLLFFSKNVWWPSKTFKLKEVKALFSFGSHVMLTSLLNVIFNNIYNVVIGKFFNPIQLGYYVQAFKIQSIPADKIQQIIKRVTFPKLAQISENKEEMSSYFLKIFKSSILVNFALLIFIAGLSKQIVLILLTQKWEPIVPFIRLLCFASLFLPLFELCSNVILSKGKSLLNFKIELLKKVLIVFNILVMFKWGIIGLIIGQIINSILFLVIQYYFTKQFLVIHLKDLIVSLLKYLIVAIIPYVIITWLMSVFTLNIYLEFIVYTTVYFLLFILLVFSFRLNQGYNFNMFLKNK